MSLNLMRPADDSTLMLLFDNFALASAGATCTGFSAGTKLPPARLVDGNPQTLWRSHVIGRNSAPHQITVRFAKQRRVSFVSLHHHNIRVPFAVDLYDGDPDLTNPVYESGWTDPIMRFELGEEPWEIMQWDLGPDPELLLALTNASALHSFIEISTPMPCTGYRIRFDVSGGENYGLSYLQASTTLAGNIWRPQINMLKGWTIQPNDMTQIETAERGQKFGIRRPAPKEFGFSFGWLRRGARDESRELFERWFQLHGKSGVVFAWPEPDLLASYYWQAGLFQLESIPEITMSHIGLAGAKGLKLCEVV